PSVASWQPSSHEPPHLGTATLIDEMFHPRSPPDISVPIRKQSCITESFRSGLNLIADVIFPFDFSTKPF
ncbi:MAG: hypothetical protein ACK53Y_20815, partial [bacterium]